MVQILFKKKSIDKSSTMRLPLLQSTSTFRQLACHRRQNVGKYNALNRIQWCYRSLSISALDMAVDIDEVDLTTDEDRFHGFHDSYDRLLADTVRPFYESQRPVIVRGAVQDSPAIMRWSDWDYWWELFDDSSNNNNNNNSSPGAASEDLDDGDGDTTCMVSVEIGGSYGKSDTERAEIPMISYLQYIQMFEGRHGKLGSLEDTSMTLTEDVIKTSELVYLAQNDLPQQLQNDVIIPSFCNTTDILINSNTTIGITGQSDVGSASADDSGEDRVGLGRLYSTMLWLGPRGCVSPMHYDPLDNLLCQYVGRKRVILFEPTISSSSSSSSSSSTSTPWHYAGHDGQQSNTSPVDVENIDATKYPLFEHHAPTPLAGVLFPGDLLYIPSKWWHFVRSIDTSASANIWWR